MQQKARKLVPSSQEAQSRSKLASSQARRKLPTSEQEASCYQQESIRGANKRKRREQERVSPLASLLLASCRLLQPDRAIMCSLLVASLSSLLGSVTALEKQRVQPSWVQPKSNSGPNLRPSRSQLIPQEIKRSPRLFPYQFPEAKQ